MKTPWRLASALIQACPVSRSHNPAVIYDISKHHRTNNRSLSTCILIFYASRRHSVGVCSDVGIVTREEWGARAPTSQTPITTPVSSVYVHHTATSQCYGRGTCEETVRSIQDYHMDDLGERTTGSSMMTSAVDIRIGCLKTGIPQLGDNARLYYRCFRLA